MLMGHPGMPVRCSDSWAQPQPDGNRSRAGGVGVRERHWVFLKRIWAGRNLWYDLKLMGTLLARSGLGNFNDVLYPSMQSQAF